jgi:hypothetical protein
LRVAPRLPPHCKDCRAIKESDPRSWKAAVDWQLNKPAGLPDVQMTGPDCALHVRSPRDRLSCDLPRRQFNVNVNGS